jgi:hypothetical protein
MFVLVHNGRVLVGPMGWNRAMFDGNLEKLKIQFTLPRAEPDVLPLVINENTVIKRVDFDYPVYNPKIQYLEGPYWDHTQTNSRAFYEVKPQPIESVKANLKQIVAENRWKKEVAGTKTTIQGVEVTVDTARGSRDIFVQKYLLLPENGTVGWKFPECWMTLTKAELGAAVSAGASHVENAFIWEATKANLIDFSDTLEQLNVINLEE